MSGPQRAPEPVMSRLVFVNRFYWPEEPATGQLLTDLAEELARRGCAVEVIASRAGDLPATDAHRGVKIHRVGSPRPAGGGAFAKAASWLGFGLGALWRIWRVLRCGDTLVFLTDPPLLPIAGGPLARLRGARTTHWVQDIYPELPQRVNGMRGLGPIRVLRDREWRKARACVTLGTDMAKVIARAGVAPDRIAVQPNWAPLGLQPADSGAVAALRAEWGLADAFIVVYSGNMGRVHDLDPVLDVAAALRDTPGIAFLFIGGGAQHRQLEASARARGLGNVQFRPPQPRSRLAVSLSVADVHLITLRGGCEDLVFPSKLYGIAAVGRPQLYIGPADSEAARVITRAGMGAAFARADIAGIASTLRTWRQKPAAVANMRQAALDFHGGSPGLAAAANFWQSLVVTS